MYIAATLSFLAGTVTGAVVFAVLLRNTVRRELTGTPRRHPFTTGSAPRRNTNWPKPPDTDEYPTPSRKYPGVLRDPYLSEPTEAQGAGYGKSPRHAVRDSIPGFPLARWFSRRRP